MEHMSVAAQHCGWLKLASGLTVTYIVAEVVGRVNCVMGAAQLYWPGRQMSAAARAILAR